MLMSMRRALSKALTLAERYADEVQYLVDLRQSIAARSRACALAHERLMDAVTAYGETLDDDEDNVFDELTFGDVDYETAGMIDMLDDLAKANAALRRALAEVRNG